MPRALYCRYGCGCTFAVCTDTLYVQTVCAVARRQSAEICSAVVCTVLYVHFVRTFSTDTAAAPRRRRNALGKPSFGFPRPFPRLEITRRKFQRLMPGCRYRVFLCLSAYLRRRQIRLGVLRIPRLCRSFCQ